MHDKHNTSQPTLLAITILLTFFLIAPSMASNEVKKDSQPNWKKIVEIDVNNISVKEFISVLNKNIESNIEVESSVNVNFSMKGKDSAINILKYMFNTTSTKLVKADGRYIIVNNSDEKIVVSNTQNKSNNVYSMVNEPENKIDNSTSYNGYLRNKSNIKQKRVIGTAIVPWEGIKGKATVWQIVTTNGNVTGYQSYMELDSGEISGVREIDRGFFNQSTGLITVEIISWEYPTLQMGVRKTDSTFIISENVLKDCDGNKIGIFYDKKLLIKNEQEIPENDGCNEIWGDKGKHIYYTKKSELFDKYPYSKYIKYFCSESEAVQAGYKESFI